MATHLKEFKNLTGILLGPIRTRPAMYLGQAKISMLANFIIGYSIGFQMGSMSSTTADDWFGEAGFLEWFCKEKKIKQPSSWQIPFLDEADNSEEKALQIFFDYLEAYQIQKETTQ